MSAFEISQRWGPMAWDLARHNEIVTSSIPFPASPCSCRFCATYIASDIRELMIILVFHIIGLGLSMVVYFFFDWAIRPCDEIIINILLWRELSFNLLRETG